MQEYPKVLVIAHNSFSDNQSNGKTLSAFFNGWPKEKIAQLYLTYDKPDITVCNKFYRITDFDVLKQFFTKKDTSKEINEIDAINDNDKQSVHRSKWYMFVRNLFFKRIPLMYCIRNMFWNLVKPWNNEKVKKWIKSFNPDIIFFQSSNVYAIFDMVESIMNMTHAKLYMETTDDYVTTHFSLDPFYWINITKMIDRYRKAINNSETIFAIGDLMAKEYKEKFGGNYQVAMNSVELKNEIISYDEVKNSSILLTYAGNLGLNRWRVLSKIGKALSKLKKDENINAKLEIYSIHTPSKKIIKKLTNDVMSFKGSLNTEELVKKRNQSDILVHVESFDKKNKYITRLSVSTKIPEYLLSQRCILAVGPKDVASIKYISDNKAGYVITSLDENNIKENLKYIILNRSEREYYIKNGKELADNRHSFEKNKQIVQRTIKQT